MAFSPPTTLREIGNYEIDFKIAEGGMGAVYKARHRDTGAEVAIKIIPPETARNQVLLRRFEQEFRAASLIDHPNVVKAIEYNGNGPSPFLVMEYVDGLCLGELVERDGPMREAFALSVIAQVCEGLHSAHKQGLIHRDVKPDNILVTKDGVAKLTDLGLVKDIDAEMNLTRTGKGLGTPHFMAPEQFRNAKNADVRCDVYSVAATLYMMVTGQVPFAKTSPLDCWLKKTKDDFPPPKALAPGLSDRIDFAIRRSMKNNAAERPANCRELMEDLTGSPWRPGQPLRIAPAEEFAAPPETSSLWYMVFYEEGQPRTVKGSTDTIRKNIEVGNLGDLTAVAVSRTKTGPFMPLHNVPEFRDLLPAAGGTSATTPLPRNSRPPSNAGTTGTRTNQETFPRLSTPETPRSTFRVPMSSASGATVPSFASSPSGFPSDPQRDLKSLAEQLPPLPEPPAPVAGPAGPASPSMPEWFPWFALIVGAIGLAIGIVSLFK
jgi:serine/threonine protein kinase